LFTIQGIKTSNQLSKENEIFISSKNNEKRYYLEIEYTSDDEIKFCFRDKSKVSFEFSTATYYPDEEKAILKGGDMYPPIQGLYYEFIFNDKVVYFYSRGKLEDIYVNQIQ